MARARRCGRRMGMRILVTVIWGSVWAWGALLCSGTALIGCASHTRLAEPTRAAISARHSGRTVELRQSMYYGDLYDENEKWLLSPYPFAETFHIVDTKGAPIHPKG